MLGPVPVRGWDGVVSRVDQIPALRKPLAETVFY